MAVARVHTETGEPGCARVSFAETGRLRPVEERRIHAKCPRSQPCSSASCTPHRHVRLSRSLIGSSKFMSRQPRVAFPFLGFARRPAHLCTKSLLRWPPHTVSLGQTFRTSGRRQVQIRLLTAATPVSNAEQPTAGAGLQAIRAWHAPRAQPKLSARASFNFRPFGPQKDRFDQASSDQASSFLVPGPHYTAGRAIEARWQNHRSRTRLWQHSLYTASVESNFKSTLTPTQTCNSVRSSLGPSASVLGFA